MSVQEINQSCKYVAYYRVSTQQQGASGLGLEAQERDVMRFTNGNIIAQFTDIESGKKNKRPELLKALSYCQYHNATLVIAKLDRLSRNVGFINQLVESKTKFICCDMPEANETIIGIMAVIAQAEQKAISTRTKAALKSLKDRGVKLGGSSKEHCDNMRAARRSKEYDDMLLYVIQAEKERGLSYEKIAEKVNEKGFKTLHNKPFSAPTIFRIYKNSVYCAGQTT